MGKQPKSIITDELQTYSVASSLIFPQAQHTRHIRLQGDRKKTMRGLKKKRTPILKGYQIYHNFIRPHMALDGKTPSEACGIKVEGENKWLTLIQNASNPKGSK